MKTQIKELDLSDMSLALSTIEEKQLLWVIDQKIYDLYSVQILKLFNDLRKMGKDILVWKSSLGEKTKTLEQYENCINYFISQKAHRKAHVIALGGGAISDFAGFVASTLYRGLSWSVIPTTLLAMVDASIGGKTGLNLEFGKNLIGSFHLPQNLFLNTDFLETLPEKEIHSGKGEILKYALLDKNIYEDLLKENFDLANIIKKCITYKETIVEEDFREGDKRKVLNLGHTFGHAIERMFDLPHGLAVVEGIFLKDFVFNANKLETIISNICSTLMIKRSMVNLERVSSNFDEFFNFISVDKKRTEADEIQFVGLKEVGKPIFFNCSMNDLKIKFGDLSENRHLSN